MGPEQDSLSRQPGDDGRDPSGNEVGIAKVNDGVQIAPESKSNQSVLKQEWGDQPAAGGANKAGFVLDFPGLDRGIPRTFISDKDVFVSVYNPARDVP